MNTRDAFKILNIESGNVTPKEIKQAYQKAAAKYHPDHNPAGLEMMKLVNVAYEALKDYQGEAVNNEQDYGDKVNDALNNIFDYGLEIEICGAWVWLSGNTKQYKDYLKKAGFKWAAKKKKWYFRPEEYRSRSHNTWSMDEIRQKYGSKKIKLDEEVGKKPTPRIHSQ